jgi:hypothetical protein
MVRCLPETKAANVAQQNPINAYTALQSNFIKFPEDVGWDLTDANLFVNECVYIDSSFLEGGPRYGNLDQYYYRTTEECQNTLEQKIVADFGLSNDPRRVLLEDPDTLIVFHHNIEFQAYLDLISAQNQQSGSPGDPFYELNNTLAEAQIGIDALQNTALTFNKIIENFFGPRHRSNLYNQSVRFWDNDRTFDDTYDIVDGSNTIVRLMFAFQKRLQVLFDRFPQHRICIYITAGANELVPEQANQQNSGSDEAGNLLYWDTDKTHIHFGLRNMLMYANRIGPYGNSESVHYVPPEDGGPELVKNCLTDSNDSNRHAFPISKLYLDGALADCGNNSTYNKKVFYAQINDILDVSEFTVTTTDDSGEESVISIKDTLCPNNESFIFAHHVALTYDDQPTAIGCSLNRDIIQDQVNIMKTLIEKRQDTYNNIFLWSSTEAEDVGMYIPERGIFVPTVNDTNGGGTEPGGPGGPLINLELFNISGCDLPPLPLPQDQLEIIESIINGEAFRSPVEGVVNEVLGTVGEVGDAIFEAIDSGSSIELGTYTDENGETQVHSPTTLLNQVVVNVTAISEEFQDHAYRLSGASNYRDGFEAGGSIGDLPGLVGLQAIAQNYNNVKNSIDRGTLGEDLVDHYSPFFQSILGPGDELYDSLNALFKGEYRNFINQFPIEDGRINFSEATQAQLQELRLLADNAFQLQISIRNLIDSDNINYFAAVDYLSKSTLGFSVLTMLEDPCFSQKLLSQVVKPDLKGLFNID